MIPTIEDAKRALDEAERHPQTTKWLQHSRCVADAVRRIAEALNAKGQHLNVELAVAMGYLHDIGKSVPSKQGHLLDGYYLMKSWGYAEEFAAISIVHHFIKNDAACSIGRAPDPEREKMVYEYVREHHFTPEEKLVVFCDSLCNSQPNVLEQRLADVIVRYGVCERTSERIQLTLERKAEYDAILGYSLYELFPEIKAHL